MYHLSGAADTFGSETDVVLVAAWGADVSACFEAVFDVWSSESLHAEITLAKIKIGTTFLSELPADDRWSQVWLKMNFPVVIKSRAPYDLEKMVGRLAASQNPWGATFNVALNLLDRF